MTPRRTTTRFDGEDVTDPQRLLRALNEFSKDISARLAPLEALSRVAVLADILLETQGTLAVNTAPFPLRVQTPFSVSGAWVVHCEDFLLGDRGGLTSGVVVWGRPVSGGTDGQGNAYEIIFLGGLAANRKYRIRLAVAGVQNG